MPPDNPEQTLADHAAELKRIAELREARADLSAADEKRAMQAQVAFRNAEEAHKNELAAIEEQNKLLNIAEEERTTTQKNKIRDLDYTIAKNEDLSKAYKNQSEQIKKLQADHKEFLDSLAQQSAQRFDDMGKRGLDNLRKTAEGVESQTGITSDKLVGAIEIAAENIGSAFVDIANNPDMLLASTFNNAVPGVNALKASILAMPAAMDTAFSSVVKNTNMGADSAKASMTAMMDPIYAARTDGAFRNLAADSKMLDNIGLTADDVGKSMSGLINNVAMFRPEFIENNKAQAAFIGNLTAGLTKVGVPIETSAKNLNRFTKAMGKSPKEAATGLKQLTGIADSLGLSFGKVSSNFAAVGGDMVQFGDKAIGVFANLQAQATATGMSINELTDFAKGLDTFEGAAQKAQGLNAVLGGTFVSVTDLVNADFDEKIELMQNAMGDAGIEFDQADRRMKQVIASAAGLSVEQASKMFGNVDASEDMKDAVDDQATSQEELSGKINDAMSISEKATKTLSSLAGGVSKFNKRLTKGAEGIAGTVADSFGKLQEATGDSEASLVGIVGQLQAMESGGSAVTAVVTTLSRALAANPVAAGLVGATGGTVSAAVAGTAITGAKKQLEKTKQEAEVPPGTAAPKAETPPGDQASASTPGEPVQVNLMVDGDVIASVLEDKNIFMRKPVQLIA